MTCPYLYVFIYINAIHFAGSRRLLTGNHHYYIGLSNSVLDKPWEKVDNGRAIFKGIVNQSNLSKEELIESLFDLLR